MIVSDAHNFASRLSHDMDQIQRERQMHIDKLSSGVKVEKSTDDAGALAAKIKHNSELKRLRELPLGCKMLSHIPKYKLAL